MAGNLITTNVTAATGVVRNDAISISCRISSATGCCQVEQTADWPDSPPPAPFERRQKVYPFED